MIRNHLAIFSLFLVLSAGCSGEKVEKIDTANVSGKVTLDGQPLASGVIIFLPEQDEQGGQLRGQMVQTTVTAGSYTANNVVIGKNRVRISSPRVVGKQMVEGVEYDKEEESIPQKYNTGSTLTALVKKDAVEHNFELTSK